MQAGAQPGGVGEESGLAGPTRYWVTLRDKQGVQFSPRRYFTAAARARRTRQHLPAFELSDLPVRVDYLQQVSQCVDTITLVSRWFNAAACRATPAQAALLRRLPGVLRVEAWPQGQRPAATAATAAPRRDKPSPLVANDILLARRQTAHLDGAALRQARLDGRGLRIAVFDVGFAGLREHPAFRQLIEGHHIVATHDFLKNRADVFHSGSHGTEVMGCLAGHLPAHPGERRALPWAWPPRPTTCWPAPSSCTASAMPRKKPGWPLPSGPTSRGPTSSTPRWLTPSSATSPST
jgi:serine protease AprX